MMKKYFLSFFILIFAVSQAANAGNYPYQPTRSTQVLGVIKKSKPVVQAVENSVSQVASKSDGSTKILAVIKKSQPVSQPVADFVNPQLELAETKDVNVLKTTNEEAKIAEEKEILPQNEQQPVVEIAPALEQQTLPEENSSNNQKEKTAVKKSSASNMKTEGHYVGFDLIANRASMYEYGSRFSGDGSKIIILDDEKQTSAANGGGVGINYKYAFNFNNFFIAPGIFAERLATEINGSEAVYSVRNAQGTELNIKSRLGIFLNAGYDINSYFSPYLMAGYSLVSYRAKNGIGNNTRYQSAVEESTNGSGIYGAGLKINYDQNISFNIEYNSQKIDLKTNTTVPVNTKTRKFTSVFRTKIDSLKIGVSYKF